MPDSSEVHVYLEDLTKMSKCFQQAEAEFSQISNQLERALITLGQSWTDEQFKIVERRYALSIFYLKNIVGNLREHKIAVERYRDDLIKALNA